jgi:hypothetical protein
MEHNNSNLLIWTTPIEGQFFLRKKQIRICFGSFAKRPCRTHKRSHLVGCTSLSGSFFILFFWSILSCTQSSPDPLEDLVKYGKKKFKHPSIFLASSGRCIENL